MLRTKKAIQYTSFTIVALVVVLLVFRLVFQNPYTSSLPKLPEAESIPETAYKQIKKYRSRAMRMPSTENMGKLGMVYHANTLYEQASTCYLQAIRKDETAWMWNYYLGYLYLEMGQSDKVLEQYMEVITLNPDAHHAYYYAGEASTNMGQSDKAEEYFGAIQDINVKGVQGSSSRVDHYSLGIYASYQLSKTYMNTGRNQLAEQNLVKIINENRNFGPAYRLLGNIYRMRGDSEAANRIGAVANDLMVYTPPVDTLIDKLTLLSRSESYLLKRIDEATKFIYSDWAFQLVENGMKEMPKSKYLLSKAIKVYLWLDKTDKAASCSKDHIEFSRNDYSELNEIGMLFYGKEEYQVSSEYFQQVLNLKPDDYECMKGLAICSWRIGDQEHALELLNKVISSHPDDLNVLAEVSDLMLFTLEEQEKSLQYYRILHNSIPRDPKVIKMSARVAELSGQTNEAIVKYEKAFLADSDDLTTIKNLGSLLTGQEMWAKAIKHYRAALSFHPRDPEILERLGTLLIQCPDASLRKVPEGRIYAERAFIHISGKPMTKIVAGRNLSLAYAMLGDVRNAMTVINMTIKIADRENISKVYVTELLEIKKLIEESLVVTD